MPNIKIFVDETEYGAVKSGLVGLLSEMRTALCSSLLVDEAAFQIAVIPVLGIAGQPPVNIEIHLMPRPERTRELLAGVANDLRAHVGKATGQRVAVRVTMIDSDKYVALK
jgi:hypothetical protein